MRQAYCVTICVNYRLPASFRRAHFRPLLSCLLNSMAARTVGKAPLRGLQPSHGQRATKPATRPGRRTRRPPLRKRGVVPDVSQAGAAKGTAPRVLPTNAALETMADAHSVRARLDAQGMSTQTPVQTWKRSYEGEAVGYSQLGTCSVLFPLLAAVELIDARSLPSGVRCQEI